MLFETIFGGVTWEMFRSNRKGSFKAMEPRFKLFFISSACLLCALCALTYAEFYMIPSVDQELIGLTALALGAISALGVLTAYIAILWQRISKFFTGNKRQ